MFFFVCRLIISLNIDFFLFSRGFIMILHYNSWKYNLLGMFFIHLFFLFSNFSRNLPVSNIILFPYRFVFFLYYFQSREYDLFIHLIFLYMFFFFSFPNLLISYMSVFFHKSVHHASTIMSYVTIIVAFVTFNVMWDHIRIFCLNISSIRRAICNFMSKINTIKTMTIK